MFITIHSLIASVSLTALGSQNTTTHFVTEFVLLGFPGPREMQNFFFSLILVVYLLTLLGNGAIVCAVKWDRQLHTPMYLFLGNFAFLEMWYVSTTIPNMLANILSAVFRVPSGAGRTKAFSTCGSHLMVVSLFYGTLMVMYVRPTSENPAGMQKIITLVYSVVTPLLNPLIYSLRNKDMKDALRRILGLGINQN
ncbi:olfactory receptor 11H6-like [Pteropus vampyrus]|uniref:Olfactory receptor 11H6-like n=1 Tax=Pteropus vampyrus TaxID=132908 RepID=A0A6P6C3E0_PTEVA|nr:olfactory receptor 11H6-like [Pteropus vampyrus]